MLNINRAILVFYIFCCQGIKGDSRNSYYWEKIRKTHDRDLLTQSSLSGFFLVLSEHLFIGEPAWKCVTSPSSVYACVHTCEQWNTVIAFKKENVFSSVFLSYPSQKVVKTRIPLDKSVSVAPDFVAYLTCQPCLCKQTLPRRVTRVSRTVLREKTKRKTSTQKPKKTERPLWNSFRQSDIVGWV